MFTFIDSGEMKRSEIIRNSEKVSAKSFSTSGQRRRNADQGDGGKGRKRIGVAGKKCGLRGNWKTTRHRDLIRQVTPIPLPQFCLSLPERDIKSFPELARFSREFTKPLHQWTRHGERLQPRN